MPYLVWINDSGAVVDRWELGDHTLVAGRGKDCEIVLTDQRASRRHFTIAPRSGRYYVTDLESANGTFVNDRRISAETAMVAGDRIRVGSTILTLEMGKPKGLATIISELQKESEESGKGFKTMMREITRDQKK
jgi:pSer/pThr/pTyr-binding forkhead associated (FHA) protein